ncbi:uncharacterized protein LOC124921320 [Impatiens glandulifera]|uniref:uncharacterized protein LOC124921320 n=1 Tax=Impatiens glandulifera TaxID=253017 RepID=UPI001FB1601B|nr:uncharacterized protein LOC124921320 [Impatiens glandulifera]
MVKGRKLTISRSERALGIGIYSYGQDCPNDSPELEEEDVWSSMVDGDGQDEQSSMMMRSEWETRTPVRISRQDNVDRGRRQQQVGGLSLAFEDNNTCPRIIHQYRQGGGGGRNMMAATSAPVNVPDWSKIYRVDSVESMHCESDDGVDERESEIVIPPHEYLAREYRKMAAKSVFEGVGRTLKGRDMRRVRDAVWSQTGFDG